MEKNENIGFIKDVTVAIAYYKLIYIESITKDKSYDAFIMLGGNHVYDRVIQGVKEENISLEKTNLEMLERLCNLVFEANCVPVSLSSITTKELEHMGWLKELVDVLDPQATLKETICNSCSFEVYNKLIQGVLTDEEEEFDVERFKEGIIDRIVTLSKKKGSVN